LAGPASGPTAFILRILKADRVDRSGISDFVSNRLAFIFHLELAQSQIEVFARDEVRCRHLGGAVATPSPSTVACWALGAISLTKSTVALPTAYHVRRAIGSTSAQSSRTAVTQ
jgi:hypothetical protein